MWSKRLLVNFIKMAKTYEKLSEQEIKITNTVVDVRVKSLKEMSERKLELEKEIVNAESYYGNSIKEIEDRYLLSAKSETDKLREELAKETSNARQEIIDLIDDIAEAEKLGIV